VPAGVNAIQVELWGAQGDGATGGRGGHTLALVAVQPGQVLEVNVGGRGNGGVGGYNGGGDAWQLDGSHAPGGGGGGATDVRIGGTLAGRVAVAGGGGGAAMNSLSGPGGGGAGGGLSGGTGFDGTDPAPFADGGVPGTQTGGFALGQGRDNSSDCNDNCGGAGGGGYWGGLPGDSYAYSPVGGGGGGGSGFIHPDAVGDTDAGVRAGNGAATISWPVPLPSAPLGLDSYGEIVNGVHTGSGNFVESVVDVTIPTIGPALSMSRTYNSQDTKVGPFGRGWTFGYETSLVDSGTTVTITHADGRRDVFTRTALGTYEAPHGYVLTLIKWGSAWLLTDKDRAVTVFDANGKMTGITDRYGRRVNLTYASGQLATVADAASGRSLSFEWTSGRVSKVSTSPVTIDGATAPLVWRYEYTNGLLTKACDARYPTTTGEKCTVYSYNATERLVQVTAPRGNVDTKLDYLADGRVWFVEDGIPNRTWYLYGGGHTMVLDPRGLITSYLYDMRRRSIRVIDPALNATMYAYDANGFRSQITDANGNHVKMAYDARANEIARTNGIGETTWMTYVNDRMTERRDARSYVTRYTYNSQGDLLTEQSPATTEFPSGVTRTTTYTAGGENRGFGVVPVGLTATTNDGDGTTTFAYDSEGDLRRRTDPSGLMTEYDHDQHGRVTATRLLFNGQTAETTQEYDAVGRVGETLEPAVTDEIAATVHRKKTRQQYDPNGNVEVITISDVGGTANPTPTRTTTTEFDNADRAFRTTEPANKVTSRTFDANGNVLTVTDPLGRTYATTYDKRNQPLDVKLLAFEDDPIAHSPARDVLLSRKQYDPAGRLVAEMTPGPAGMPMVVTRTAYDRADRVLARTVTDFDNLDGSRKDIVLTAYTYDATGNVINESSGNGARVVENAVDEMGRIQSQRLRDSTNGDRITDFDYDATGDRTRVVQKNASGSIVAETTSTYSPAGFLDAQTVKTGSADLVTRYVNDPRGLRTAVLDARSSGPTDTAFRSDMRYDLLGRPVETLGPPITVESDGGAATTTRPRTRTGYDAVGNVVDQESARGARTRSTFDVLDRQIQIDHPSYTRPDGVTLTPYETFTYDNVGNLISKRDRRGQVTDYTFDARNRVVRQLDPQVAGETTRGVSRFEYDDAGNRTRVVDPTGAETRFGFDDLGQMLTQTAVVRQPMAQSFVTTSIYDDLGNLVQVTDPTGVDTKYKYNADGQQTQLIDDAHVVVTHTDYDAAGRVVRTADALGRKVEQVLDLAGRVTSTRDLAPNNTVLATRYFGYDAVGNRTHTRSARSASAADDTYLTLTTFDAANLVRSVREPGNATSTVTWNYGYDVGGKVTRVADTRPAPGITTYKYSPWDTLEKTTEPGGATFTTIYDAGGLPIEDRQPGNVSVARTFDELGRARTEAGSGTGVVGATSTFGYDLAGRMRSFSHPDGTVNVARDDRGLLLSTTVPGSAALASQFSYDGAGRMLSRADAAGATTFAYDTRGRLDAATDGLTGRTSDYVWNNAGQVTAVNFNTSPTTAHTYAYDDSARVTTDTVKRGSTTLMSTAYSYDADSNVTGQTITAAGNPAAGAHTYTYDRSGRLTQWTPPSGPAVAYAYDQAGNRTQAGTEISAYNTRNQLLVRGSSIYAWTPRGALDSVTTGGVTTDVDFDALGRQIKYGPDTFTYDAQGRVADAGATEFTYAGLEIDGVKAANDKYARTPGGELLSTTDGTTPRLVGENRHGDVSWLLSSTGTLDATRVWDPYGKPAGSVGVTGLDVGYQGDWTHSSGLVGMGARWYDPNTGGFTARDTVFGTLDTPVSLNRYTYANNDPLQYFDPDGRSACISDSGLSGCVFSPGTRPSAATARTASDQERRQRFRMAVAAPRRTASANYEAFLAKRLTALRAAANSEMKQFLGDHHALPRDWETGSDGARTSYFMWAVLRNGNQILHSQGDFLRLSGAEQLQLWEERQADAFHYIGDRDCDGAMVPIVCRNRNVINGISTAFLAVGLGMVTGGAASAALAPSVGATAGTVVGGTIGSGFSSAAAQQVTTGEINWAAVGRDAAIGGGITLGTLGAGWKLASLRQQRVARAALQEANLAQTANPRPGAAGALVGRDNQIAVSRSVKGGLQPLQHPSVQEALDAVPLDLRTPWHGMCVEPQCVSQMLSAGANPRGGVMSTALVRARGNPLHGTALPPCSSCQHVLRQFEISWVAPG
jgi:RHS repeat-associated protein